MKRVGYSDHQILYLLIIFCIGTSGCLNEQIFSIQNCYGSSVEIEIEFVENQKGILPEIAELLTDNKINFKLDYPKRKNILKTTVEDVKNGLPFKRMTIKKLRDTTTINYGDKILDLMDVDVIGDLTCSICV